MYCMDIRTLRNANGIHKSFVFESPVKYRRNENNIKWKIFPALQQSAKDSFHMGQLS